jgi:hypothetical protein
MRRNALMLAGVLALPLMHGPLSRGGDKTPFAFPDDQAGRLLEKLLRPGQPASSRSGAALRAQASFASARVEDPTTPLTPVQVELPKIRLAPASMGRPRAVAEQVSLPGQDPRRPQTVGLPPGTRIRLESEDVNKPIPLPTLGQAQPDRAPLTDPTLEASVAAALAGRLPGRTAPAPFVRLNLPDPFENSHAVRLRTPPPESPSPSAAMPRTPGR